jgi:hypothetical protein
MGMATKPGTLMVWLVGLGWAFAALVVAVFALAAWGQWRWTIATRNLVDRLTAARVPPLVARYDARELAGLPAPVQRYFRAVLKDGQSVVTTATVDHVGRFNLSASGEQWRPFTSHQAVTTRRPGLVWNGWIASRPGLAVLVHDAYLVGDGVLNPAVLGLFALGGGGSADHDTLARGELIRYLAEAAWYPTALLPSQGVRWAAVDNRSADATLVDGRLRITMRFRFDAEGLIESARAEERGALIANRIVMTPWEGRWSDYQWRDGMRVPLTGEAAWLGADSRRPYWRGTIVRLIYGLADTTPTAPAAPAASR